MSTYEILSMARSLRDIKDRLHSKHSVLLEHLLKVLLFPDNRSSVHWCKEIQSWVREAVDLTRNLSDQSRRRLLTDFTFAFFDSPNINALAAEISSIDGYLLPSWIKRSADALPVANALLLVFEPLLSDLLDCSLERKFGSISPELFKKHRPDLSEFGL